MEIRQFKNSKDGGRMIYTKLNYKNPQNSCQTRNVKDNTHTENYNDTCREIKILVIKRNEFYG